MSWYDEDWSFRRPIALHNPTGLATPDMDLTLSPSHGHIWANMQADFDDLRICKVDGHTLITTWELTAFDYAANTATISFGNGQNLFADPGSIGVDVLWLYYGNAAATDASSTYAQSIDFDGLVFPSDPRTDPSKVVVWRPTQRGASEPLRTVVISEAEAFLVWFDVTDAMQRAEHPFEGSLWLEEIKHFVYTVSDGGVADATAVDMSKAQIYQTDNGQGLSRLLLGCHVDAGAAVTGDELLLHCTFYTAVTSNATRRVRDVRAILKVQQPAD